MDLIRARGYAIYKQVLLKALNFLMNAVLASVVTHYEEWEAKVILKMRVSKDEILCKEAKLIVTNLKEDKNEIALLETDTTIIDKADLNSMDSGLFETVIKTIKDNGE